MLRLWPEQVTVGLFPGHCWLRRRGRSSPGIDTAQAGTDSLAPAFDSLLAATAPLRGARLDLVVSDRAARIAPLPWQERLGSRSEWEAYARAAHDAAGMALDGGWACVPAVRRYGEQGLALALPVGWLATLEEIARRHGGRLRTVMPLSGAAYWSPRRWMPAKGTSWLLLQESEQVTLLSFSGRSSIGYDTQPALDARGLRQLLQRGQLAGSPTRAVAWRTGGEPQIDVLQAIVPEAGAIALPTGYWDRHA